MKKFSLLISLIISIFGIYILWTGNISTILIMIYGNIDDNLMIIEGLVFAVITFSSISYTIWEGLEEFNPKLLEKIKTGIDAKSNNK